MESKKMALTPWHKVATPREDLREGKPLDASRFAVHLDQVRDGNAPDDYKKPSQFFERTYLTKNLTSMAAEVARRLSGDATVSAVYNMATQFGGGKTHALTLLYHLAQNGPAASSWTGVDKILEEAGLDAMPKAATAVFVGTEFDSIAGRGGDGEPTRKTPWGEIAFQLGGMESFNLVRDHETEQIAPGGDVIRKLLPRDRPCIILMDELMNYVSRFRKYGLSDQLYDFLQNLSGVASGLENVVLVVSIPASEMEMTSEDEQDYGRLKKLLDRTSKAVIMSADADTAEIIRRRLFEWGSQMNPDGRVQLSKDAIKTCREYAAWVRSHKNQVPGWFPVDQAQEAFEAAYPFHPIVLSVFERKWQALPRFQRTRGVLRLLAFWVSKAYQENYTGAHSDALIGLGTAPLDDPIFRAATFEQLGEDKLEGAVTTDIMGKNDSHAIRLDKESTKAIQRARLHRKVAAAIFFESNGGQTSGTDASLPEIRLGVAEPDLDIGNVETVLEALSKSCYFLTVDGNRYRFSLKPNLNKIFVDRQAGIERRDIDDSVRNAILKVFNDNKGIKPIPFPEKSNDIPDHPALTIAILSPNHRRRDDETIRLVESLTRDHGTSARTFKSAIVWAIAENDAAMASEARKLLAWEKIRDEERLLHLDDGQKRFVNENIAKARRDLEEAVWRSYKNIALLDKENKILLIDLGLAHSSAAKSLIDLYINDLRQKGIVEDRISPNFLMRNWPPAFKEWSTRAVRDTFFASPQFPRLLDPSAVKETIANGVSNGIFAYVGKAGSGRYDPIFSNTELRAGEVEISDEIFIVKEPIDVEIDVKKVVVSPDNVVLRPGDEVRFVARGFDDHGREVSIEAIGWSAFGGSIDDSGSFRSGPDEGTFVVKAVSGGIAGEARVVIKDEEIELQRVVITPQDVTVSPGSKQAFSVRGFDQNGQEVSLSNVIWEATGGVIAGDGFFEAGTDEGSFSVTARSGDLSGSSQVTIKSQVVAWDGDVPPQKWMNFYTKVLSKFVSRKGLKLRVFVEVSDASVQEIEEMRSALMDLGLEDELEVK
ncbi:DUF499 domain-containing protein [Methanotrichaceae archaeon Mx]|uniref:DUF499 domain-containing protein n=2 Tax=Candidatus Methanocrinis natronophilus TaxID=3033396 RepID=A0ABT5X4Q2_9EURY|nr:DUF499 domain-containing protein [Candidatus Methanocrinis natronophilus]